MRKSTAAISAFSLAIVALVVAAKSAMTISAPIAGSTFEVRSSKYTSAKGVETSISMGRFLADQLPRNVDCCAGVYSFTIPRLEADKLGPIHQLAVFFPALGGAKQIRINGNVVSESFSRAVSVGPVVGFRSLEKGVGDLKIEVEISSRNLNVAGIWKAPPIVGLSDDLQILQQNAFRSQVLIPLFDGIIVAILSLMFFVIHAILRKRASYFLLFASTLASWALFFISLSGSFRDVSLDIGALSHLPIRTVAGFFILRLSEELLSVRQWASARKVFAAILILEFILGVFISESAQAYVFVVSGCLLIVPIWKFFQLDRNRQKIVPFILFAVFFAGQSSDAMKVLSAQFGLRYPLPYFNRYTLFPFLAYSFVFALIKFSDAFRSLNLQLLRTRQVSSFGAKLSRLDPAENEIYKIGSKLRRLSSSRVCFLIYKNEDGSFEMKSTSGRSSDKIDPKCEGLIQNWFNNNDGETDVQTLDLPTGERIYIAPYETENFRAALVFIRDEVFGGAEEGLSFITQAISILRTSQQRASERAKRELSEAKFRTVIQKLDPNLYAYVEQNKDKLVESFENESRGIIFFDQKGYTTLLEDLDEKHAFALAETVNRWVAERTAKYAARVLNFNGDAYTLELLALPGETTSAIANRVCDLVWELSQSTEVLNRSLLKLGIPPIVFRFGANIGKASALSLEFISAGTKNIVGDNVNVAARLQSIARPGSVYVSSELANDADQKYVFRRVPRSYVKGRRREVEVFELVGRSEEKNDAA